MRPIRSGVTGTAAAPATDGEADDVPSVVAQAASPNSAAAIIVPRIASPWCIIVIEQFQLAQPASSTRQAVASRSGPVQESIRGERWTIAVRTCRRVILP